VWPLGASTGAQVPAQPSQSAPELPPLSAACGAGNTDASPLPFCAVALQKTQENQNAGNRIGVRGRAWCRARGPPPLLRRILEHSVKGLGGLGVEMINRGVAGELAKPAATRMKIDVALDHPDLVLWQVGTNDAFAPMPVAQFQDTVSATVQWLRGHEVDVILVGLHYMKHSATNAHYQAIRASLRHVSAAENVLRTTRYEAMEVLARERRAAGRPDPDDFGLTEVGYNCMAQYVARAIAVGLFAKVPQTRRIAGALAHEDGAVRHAAGRGKFHQIPTRQLDMVPPMPNGLTN
jgi:acyl-CoA thioesterase I